MIKSKAWVDLYAPQKLEDCFLPSATRKELEAIIKSGELPSMLFVGPPGIGKTTVAKVLSNELGYETQLINASLVGIDAVRTDIISFSSTISMYGTRKVCILDEADGLTHAAQNALRGIINEYANNVSFILTGNFINKIIEPLQSRLTPIDFKFKDDEVKKILALGIFKFIEERLKEEDVDYDIKAVQKFVVTNISNTNDIRKIITRAQKIARTKVFHMDSIFDYDSVRLDEILEHIKKRDFNKLRTWVSENSDIDSDIVIRYLYEKIPTFPSEKHGPITIIIADYAYKQQFVNDIEINTSAMLAEIALL